MSTVTPLMERVTYGSLPLLLSGSTSVISFPSPGSINRMRPSRRESQKHHRVPSSIVNANL